VSAFAIRNTVVEGLPVDVTLLDGRIAAIDPPGQVRTAASAPNRYRFGADESVDAGGGALIPGLHDHHIHLMALAAARSSTDVSPAAVRGVADFRAALGESRSPRAVGYHESVAGPLDRWKLDAIVGDRPVRVQHRSGALWVLSSAALAALPSSVLDHPGVGRDETGRPTGELFGLDAELRDHLGATPPDLAVIGDELARYGVTGVTDMTPSERAGDLDQLAEGVLAPAFPVRVMVSGGPALAADAGSGLERGPVKLMVADHRLPAIDDLVSAFRAARRQHRPVAVHCVTRVALVLALAAWHDVGSVAGDRIEHGAVIPLELLDDIHRFGLTVVTQPSFVGERGDDYRRDVDAADQDDLWRCRSLLDAGVRVGGSTDAPYGAADPWSSVRAAIDRTTPSGLVLGPAERLDAGRAVALFLSDATDPGGPPRRVHVGAPAELCLLRASFDELLRAPECQMVRGTYGRAGWREAS
jgi:predicted amidohydrolase YtcJ